MTYLVRDLPGLTTHDSMFTGRPFWANSGNITWFTAMTASGTLEIFKTDGTAAGTVQVTHGSGVPESLFHGPFLGLVNGKLVYGGADATGPGLFSLDTTGGDPVLLGRFQLNYLTNAVVRGNTLYFSGRPTNSSEHELWSTGGTPATTAKIDLLPGNQGAFNGARDTHVYSAGQWLFFFGTTPQGSGVHRTDGTAANTQLLMPLSATALANDTEAAISFGSVFLFFLRTGQLWATDGTGTTQIGAPVHFVPLGVVGGRLLFDNGSGISATDGTLAGTQTTNIPVTRTGLSIIGHVVGDRLFLVVPGVPNAKLYVTDGTAAGTHAIMDVNQGNAYTVNEGFGIANFYYFRHDDGVHGTELWRTDGTSTELFADINPGFRSGIIDAATGFERPDGKTLFAALNYNYGREPWITDGTSAGTQLLKNVATDDSLSASSPNALRATGERVFFLAFLTGGTGVGVSDGTGAGTTATLVDFSAISSETAAANGRYFFDGYLGSSAKLYASDGTTAPPTTISADPAQPVPLPNGVVFIDHAGDLWFSDGTTSGTRKLRSLGSSFAQARLFPAGGTAWIVRGPALWKTDVTDSGTVQIVPNPAPTQSSQEDAADLIASGIWVYFIEGSTSGHGYRLWRSDGTAAGTTVVKDLGTNGATFVGAAGQLVYLSVNGKLYRSDGTDSGTIALPVDAPCPAGTSRGDAFLVMSYTMIPPFNGAVTATMWRTDGTVAGTTSLAVMQPPSNDRGGCSRVVVHGDNAYFSGWDAAHGWELWQSDGTAAGTRLNTDIYPGTKSSSPQELTLAGSHLFFSAASPNIGRELWAVSPQPTRHRAVRP